MNLRDIRVLYLREMRSALRDRTIVVAGILVPVVLYPFILWLTFTGFTFVSGQTADLKSRVMARNLSPAGWSFVQKLETNPDIELKTVSDPGLELRNGRLDALVELLPPESPSIDGDFRMRLTFDSTRSRSENAQARMEKQLQEFRNRELEHRAGQLGISGSSFAGFRVESSNISSNRQMAQLVLGLILPTFLLIILATGAMYPAIDATAGEREHSTWETIMTTATERQNVVISKYLYVATMSFIAGLLNLIAMMISLRTVLAPMFRLASDAAISIPLASIPIILLGAALMALFLSAVMLILASFARTFKEGQSMVSPFYVVIVAPLMFLSVPGLQFTPKLALIPVLNVTMMFREAIQGRFHWSLIGLTILVELACIGASVIAAASILKFEDVVTGSYSGSFARFASERIFRSKSLRKS